MCSLSSVSVFLSLSIVIIFPHTNNELLHWHIYEGFSFYVFGPQPQPPFPFEFEVVVLVGYVCLVKVVRGFSGHSQPIYGLGLTDLQLRIWLSLVSKNYIWSNLLFKPNSLGRLSNLLVCFGRLSNYTYIGFIEIKVWIARQGIEMKGAFCAWSAAGTRLTATTYLFFLIYSGYWDWLGYKYIFKYEVDVLLSSPFMTFNLLNIQSLGSIKSKKLNCLSVSFEIFLQRSTFFFPQTQSKFN